MFSHTIEIVEQNAAVVADTAATTVLPTDIGVSVSTALGTFTLTLNLLEATITAASEPIEVVISKPPQIYVTKV